MYAAIGSDGNRAVVWGLGETEEAAELEARGFAEDNGCDAKLSHTVPVTEHQARQIRAGNVDVKSLGLDSRDNVRQGELAYQRRTKEHDVT